jgi:hypothetical protein
VTEDDILAPMVAEIEKEVRARRDKWEREAQVAQVETQEVEDPWWL